MNLNITEASAIRGLQSQIAHFYMMTAVSDIFKLKFNI